MKHFAEHIPKAFPGGSDMILDAEVLMVDNSTGKPLPFGSLGIHKGTGFKDAVPCLFVFDVLFYNGQVDIFVLSLSLCFSLSLFLTFSSTTGRAGWRSH